MHLSWDVLYIYSAGQTGRWGHTYYPTIDLFAHVRPGSKDIDNKGTAWSLNRVQLLLAIWELMKWLSFVKEIVDGSCQKIRTEMGIDLMRLHQEQNIWFYFFGYHMSKNNIRCSLLWQAVMYRGNDHTWKRSLSSMRKHFIYLRHPWVWKWWKMQTYR